MRRRRRRRRKRSKRGGGKERIGDDMEDKVMAKKEGVEEGDRDRCDRGKTGGR